MRAPTVAVLLVAVLLAAAPAPGARSSPLDGVRDAALLKGAQVGLGERPSTREKRILGQALARLDRPRASLLDDLRAAGPVSRLLERGFPGDPLLGSEVDAALEALRQEIHGEQPTLLEWTVRVRTDRDRNLLERGMLLMNDIVGRYDGEANRAKRARLLLGACRIVERTRRRIHLGPPRVDPPRFEGLAPDFSLVDENPASATAGRTVSPGDYLGKATAVFFMAST